MEQNDKINEKFIEEIRLLKARIAELQKLESERKRQDSRRLADARQSSEKYFASIIDSVADPIFVKDREHRWVLFNKAFCAFMGHTAEEIKGKPDDVFWSKDEELFRNGSGNVNEEFFTNATGERRTIVTKKTLYKEETGKEYLVGIIRDISDRKKAAEELSASEIRYRRLFEAARDGILILDAETGMIIDVNPYVCELLSIPKEAILNKRIWDLGSFRDIVANQIKFMELQQKEYVRYDNLPLETADGRKIAVEFVSNVYLAEQNKVIQCNIRNITERKKTENEIRKRSQELEVFYKASIGREERILELKKENENLKQNLRKNNGQAMNRYL